MTVEEAKQLQAAQSVVGGFSIECEGRGWKDLGVWHSGYGVWDLCV